MDRDDTLIRCDEVAPNGDLGDPGLVVLLDGAFEACRQLRDAGFALVVVTNQGGVARGKYGRAEVEAVNARVNELLGGQIDAFRYCPYHPKGSVPEFTREHPFRKPAPGMILDAAEKLNLDLARSWMVGDKVRDCEAGRSAGCKTIFLSGAENVEPHPAIDWVAPDVAGAAAIIIG